MAEIKEVIASQVRLSHDPMRGFVISPEKTATAIINGLLENTEIDIPDAVFQSAEAKQCGFTKRSFLEAGWRKVK